jgi:hypothetical protein
MSDPPLLDDRREENLLQIRREAELKGRVNNAGVRPEGSPFPLASPQTGYYEQPLLKEPQWTQLIPFYFFVGGAAGSLGVIGSLADLMAGEKALARDARSLALGGSVLSGALLVTDLGRPSRFLNMLRVFKPQSTMSMGSWILSGFSGFAFLSSGADVLEYFRGPNLLVHLLRGMGRIGSVAFGMPFHNYTGVLLAATALPVWNARAHSLPGHFGMSGLQAGASILELIGHEDSRSLNLLGLFSASMETWEMIDIAFRRSQALLPLKEGSSGALISAGAWLSGPLPLMLRAASLRTRRPAKLRRVAAWSGIVGSLFTRYGWVQAGKSSARDWRLPLGIEAPKRTRNPERWFFAGSAPRQPASLSKKVKSMGAFLLLAAAVIAVVRKR